MPDYDNWPELYAQRTVTAAEAASRISPGSTICLPATSLVPTLARAIMERADELPGTEVYACAPVFDPGWFTPGHPNINAHIETFNTVACREAYVARRSDYTNVLLSRRFKAEDERGIAVHPIDVTLISVSPPDRWGFCSFGLGMWNKLNFVRHADLTIAEINPGHPRTGGTNRVHVSEIDLIVEELDPPQPINFAGANAVRPLEPNIVDAVARLVYDGDTIQIGTGGRTNQLVNAGVFDQKHDLGYHGELSVPGLNRLVREGILNGSRKTKHPGKYVATSLLATTQDEIDFINENPLYEVYEVEYTNDPRVIAEHDNMVAINNALSIDFYGHINAESIDGSIWSGPGGQPEFAMGAFLSRGGRNITIIESAAKGGEISRIMPVTPPGTSITVPRFMADYVVTEYGVASLMGKSDRQRADELISVAHPDHRAELRREAQKMFHP